MRPDQRPRTGVRRDGGVRTIHSRDVRYPRANLPAYEEFEERARTAGVLGEARDTGLAIEGRLARTRRLRARQRKQRITLSVIGIAVLASLALGWRYSSDRVAANHPLGDSVAGASETGKPVSGRADSRVSMSAATQPQPVFASYKALKLRLPVPVDKLTELGFHQASYTYALHLKTPLPDADSVAAKKNKTTGRTAEQRTTGAGAVLGGTVLRLWRSRPGKPDSAVDVGAPAGTTVYSPVDGTVIKIKQYKLYGRIDDFELHIQPSSATDIDVVMIHITDLSIAVGDHVTAGITPVAHVRNLHKQVHHQLGDYTTGGGDHVHFQLNNTNDPQYKGLEGATLPDGS